MVMEGMTQTSVMPASNSSIRESDGIPVPLSILLRAEVRMSAAPANCWAGLMVSSQSAQVVSEYCLDHVCAYLSLVGSGTAAAGSSWLPLPQAASSRTAATAADAGVFFNCSPGIAGRVRRVNPMTDSEPIGL